MFLQGGYFVPLLEAKKGVTEVLEQSVAQKSGFWRGLYFCRPKWFSRDARNSPGFIMSCIYVGSVFHRIAAE